MELTEELLEEYVTLNASAKSIEKRMKEIKSLILETHLDEAEYGDYSFTVTERSRMDLNKEAVNRLLEELVNDGVLTVEQLKDEFIKEINMKIVKVK